MNGRDGKKEREQQDRPDDDLLKWLQDQMARECIVQCSLWCATWDMRRVRPLLPLLMESNNNNNNENKRKNSLFPFVVCFSAWAVVAVRNVTESLRPLAFELNAFNVKAVLCGKFSTVNIGDSNEVTFTWRCSFSVNQSNYRLYIFNSNGHLGMNCQAAL